MSKYSETCFSWDPGVLTQPPHCLTGKMGCCWRPQARSSLGLLPEATEKLRTCPRTQLRLLGGAALCYLRSDSQATPKNGTVAMYWEEFPQRPHHLLQGQHGRVLAVRGPPGNSHKNRGKRRMVREQGFCRPKTGTQNPTCFP